MNIELLIQVSYFVVAVLFILGLKAMSSPVTAKKGINGALRARLGAGEGHVTLTDEAGLVVAVAILMRKESK